MDWTIVAKKGLGRLAFGMSPQQVAAFDPIYGPPDGATPGAHGSDLSAAHLQELIDTYGPAEAEAIIAAIGAAAQGAPLLTEYRAQSDIGTSYDRSGLSEIQVGRGCSALNIDGARVFAADPWPFLAALERANGAPALVDGQDCVFANLCIYVWSAFERTETGELRSFAPDAEEAGETSLILMAAPRQADEDFSAHVPVSFARR